jgi:hypothetical protein
MGLHEQTLRIALMGARDGNWLYDLKRITLGPGNPLI